MSQVQMEEVPEDQSPGEHGQEVPTLCTLHLPAKERHSEGAVEGPVLCGGLWGELCCVGELLGDIWCFGEQWSDMGCVEEQLIDLDCM